MNETKAQLILRLLAEAEIGKTEITSIPDALEFRRDQYGLTRQEFCAVIGISISHYSEVLSGKRSLPIKATKRAYYIGVPARILLQNDA